MPKQKTHKGSVKRIRITAKGKVRRTRAFRRHLMSAKSSKRRRQLRRPKIVGGPSGKEFRAET
ncbi:MAG: 50S ribosomal protein L35 [Planctomycetota bacterium]